MSKTESTLTERVLAKTKKKQKGGGSKKIGRNKVKCAFYRANRSVRNKLAKLKRHLGNHPTDHCALAAKARV